MQRGHGLYNGTFANKAVLVGSDEEKETRLFKNVNLLRLFDHPNIVRLEGYSALWKPVLLLMENMFGGPLLTYLRGNGISLTNRKRTDVARGMAYLHKDKFIHSYTLSSDVWSFGILMWETFSSGLLPYPGLSNKETTEQVPKGYRMKSPDDTPKSCYSLMLKCWEENPTKRGNFEEIVKKLQTIVQKTK
uniref:Tyrosine-protein kinase Fps85D n=1 Tax=Magallana gigas TaxID=29159 RepID=K1PF28_MAGGI